MLACFTNISPSFRIFIIRLLISFSSWIIDMENVFYANCSRTRMYLLDDDL